MGWARSEWCPEGLACCQCQGDVSDLCPLRSVTIYLQSHSSPLLSLWPQSPNLRNGTTKVYFQVVRLGCPQWEGLGLTKTDALRSQRQCQAGMGWQCAGRGKGLGRWQGPEQSWQRHQEAPNLASQAAAWAPGRGYLPRPPATHPDGDPLPHSHPYSGPLSARTCAHNWHILSARSSLDHFLGIIPALPTIP